MLLHHHLPMTNASKAQPVSFLVRHAGASLAAIMHSPPAAEVKFFRCMRHVQICYAQVSCLSAGSVRGAVAKCVSGAADARTRDPPSKLCHSGGLD